MDYLFHKTSSECLQPTLVTMKLTKATFACFRMQNVSIEKPAYLKAAPKKFDKKAAGA
jgi:hypothetical protein